MPLVVFLRGVNVGGHRTFRPSVLTKQLQQFHPVNIGAAGTFVFHAAVTRTRLRREIARRLPFDTEIILCDGRDILKIMTENPFERGTQSPTIVRFLSILSRVPRSEPALPLYLPSKTGWLVRILERRGRFVFGEYRRHMKTIRYLGKTDGLFDASITTRNWNTITAIATALSTKGKKI